MTNAIERADGMQQIATVLRHEQQTALELLLLGHSDIEIAKAIDLRRETIWRGNHRDPAFQAALRERQATMADAAAERLRGLVDQAVSVVQRSLSSAAADPKLAMALLSALGVLDRSRGLGQAQAAPAGLVEAGEGGRMWPSSGCWRPWRSRREGLCGGWGRVVELCGQVEQPSRLRRQRPYLNVVGFVP